VSANVNNEGSSISFFSHKLSHQSLTWGMTLSSINVIISLLEKLWIEKYPSSRFEHLSTTFASILPSNIGISKLICTLKGRCLRSRKMHFLLVVVKGFAQNYPSSHSFIV
jgi:hypothetical protein